MMTRCESLLQRAVEVEEDGPDRRFVDYATRGAAGRSAGVRGGGQVRGRQPRRPCSTSATGRFRERTRAGPRAHAALTDRVVPPIIDRASSSTPVVMFAAPATGTGYIGTHNRRFSRPQGPDPR